MRNPIPFIAFGFTGHRAAVHGTLVLMLVAALGCGDSPSAPSPFGLRVTSVVPATGPSGSAVDVTITGAGFRAGASVTVGAAATNVVVVSSTTITATVLPHPDGSVDVVVTVPERGSAMLAGGYTFVPVEMLAVTPRGVAGSTVIISGTGFLPGVVVTFDGISAAVTGVTSTAITATVPVHANGPVTVVVTNPGGQSDTRGDAFVYDVLTTVSVTPTSIAPGGQLRVSWVAPASRVSADWIRLFRLGDPNTSYLWYEYTGGAASGTLTVTAPIQPGQYQFLYLLDDGYVDTARSEVFTVTASGLAEAPAQKYIFSASCTTRGSNAVVIGPKCDAPATAAGAAHCAVAPAAAWPAPRRQERATLGVSRMNGAI